MEIFYTIIWDARPEIFTIFGREIRWYGLFFAIGFFLAYMIMAKVFQRERYSVELLDKLTLYLFIGLIVGLRLGHTMFYHPGYYLSHPLEILMIWKGGLASHGGAIGLLLAGYLYVRKYKMPFPWIMARVSMVVPLTGGFVRFGNLMNSEIIGKPTDVPWAFIFTSVDQMPRHPSQIYEALSYWALFVFMVFYYRRGLKKGKINDYKMFGMYLSILFTIRLVIEFLKDIQVGFEQNMFLNMGQLLSIPFILAGLYLYFVTSRRQGEGREIPPAG